jgi:hypothetical protein
MGPNEGKGPTEKKNSYQESNVAVNYGIENLITENEKLLER